MSAPWRLGAVALAGEIAAGRLTAVAAVEAVLAQIAAREEAVNAFACVDAEGALAAAARADAAEGPRGVLHGVPFTVKDLLVTAGMETAFGSHAFAGRVPSADAEAVARMRRAGAILIGKTTTPEFGHKVLTDSPRHGITRNPWGLERSPGGSSGGAAVAVAMGFGPLAVSTDGAGSGRIPASCCGIVGLKPTHGRVPHETHTDLFSGLTCIGAMGRSVADVDLMFGVMAGSHPGDPWSQVGHAVPELPADPVAALGGVRLRWLARMGNDWLDSEVEAACVGLLERLAGAGAVLDRRPAEIDWGLASGRRLMRAYQAGRFGPLLAEWEDRLDPGVVAGIREGQALSLADLTAAQADRSRVYRDVQGLLEGGTILATPVVATPTLAVGQQAEAPLVAGGVERGPLRAAWYPYTIPFNLTGHPALSVPCGVSSDGLPIGLQLVGPWHSEGRLLAIAAAVEALAPWAGRWPAGEGGAC